ncbi:MAG: MerR family transcriptional regulator, partial [Pseudonocardiaceae bacterium]
MNLTAMMTIGQAAKAAGVTTKAVQLYEAKGLLPPAERSPAGYRLYVCSDVEMLTFIHRARTLGLHLDGIRAILAVRSNGNPPCPTVRA